MANRSIQAKILKMKRRGKTLRFSRQVINTGRGPNVERMAEYYARVSAESYETTLAEDLEIKDIRYAQITLGVSVYHRITLVDCMSGKLELIVLNDKWFFVDFDRKTNTLRRSRDYGSKAFAMGRLKNKMVTWVETILMKTT